MASPPIYNPVVPCVHPVPGGLFPGRMIRVQGTVPPGGQRFAINLQCGPNTDPRDDIALHLNFRFVEMCVVRNHLTAMNWGVEETAGGMPLVRGEAFEALLLCDPQSIKVALNGAHFCEFPHRVPFQRISHVTVDGDVHIQFIGFEGAQAPPQQQMYMQSEPPSYSYGAPPPAYGAPGYGAPQGFGGQMPPQQYAGGVAPQQRSGMGTGAAIGLGAGALAAGGLAGYAMGGGFNRSSSNDVDPFQDPVSASTVPPVPVDWYENTNRDNANQNPVAPAPEVVQTDATEAAATAPEEPVVDENPPMTEPEQTEDADDDYLTQDPVEDPPEENPPMTEPEQTEDADDDYLTQDPVEDPPEENPPPEQTEDADDDYLTQDQVEDPPEEVETADIGDFGGDDDWMD